MLFILLFDFRYFDCYIVYFSSIFVFVIFYYRSYVYFVNYIFIESNLIGKNG